MTTINSDDFTCPACKALVPVLLEAKSLAEDRVAEIEHIKKENASLRARLAASEAAENFHIERIKEVESMLVEKMAKLSALEALVGEKDAQIADMGRIVEISNLLTTSAPLPKCPECDEQEWRPIETAPKGYPALEEPSEWFLAVGKPGPKGHDIAVIRRCFGHGFGPWECTGDAYYKADFFTHWMPLPDVPESRPEEKKS